MGKTMKKLIIIAALGNAQHTGKYTPKTQN